MSGQELEAKIDATMATRNNWCIPPLSKAHKDFASIAESMAKAKKDRASGDNVLAALTALDEVLDDVKTDVTDQHLSPLPEHGRTRPLIDMLS